MTQDPYNLQRFVESQERVYQTVCAELRAGRKESHWMWYIFPQIAGLGYSKTAQHYGISSIEEAKAYLEHAVLGPRLVECCGLVNLIEGRTIEQIFGYPDHLKFRSCVTLFREAATDKEPFEDALRKYFGGEPDVATLEKLGLASRYVEGSGAHYVKRKLE